MPKNVHDCSNKENQNACDRQESAEPMNRAAMRLRSGVGGVMPKVMMKASAMDSSNFMESPILF